MELAHQLEPVRDAGKRPEGLGDGVVGHAGGACHGGRGGGVLPVVPAGDQRLCGERVVGRELDPVDSEPAGNDFRARALEDAELRIAVRLEGAVPVEVVGLQVEQDGDVARERVDVLELEARELADDPRVFPGHQGGVGERATDVARDQDVPVGGAEDRAEQLGRRRLPVGAGDADEACACGQQPIAELDLAPDGNAARARTADERRLGRNARALDDQFDSLEQRLLLRSESEFDAEAVEPAGVDVGRAVRRDDLNAARGERSRCREARPREPDDERPARQPGLCGRRLFGTCPAHGARSPPMGGAGPLGSAYAPERNGILSTLSRMGYEFAVRLPHPQPRRPLTTASWPTCAASTCSKPAAASARANSSPAAASGSANDARPPGDSTRASSSTADTSAPVVRGDPADGRRDGVIRERQHGRLTDEVRHPARAHGMCLAEQLLELVHLRPDDVDPAVPHALVRSQRQRLAVEHEHVVIRLQARGVEQRLLHFVDAHLGV